MQAYRWVIDSRDEYTDERLEKLGGDMKLKQSQKGMTSFVCKFPVELKLTSNVLGIEIESK